MVASLLTIARYDDSGTEHWCLECMKAHKKPETFGKGVACSERTERPFRGLYDWVWSVRQIDEEDPSLDDLVLWREIKKQVRMLKEELGNEE